MARQQAVAEVNAFVKGLITEASPLTFPDNASIDELNLVLNNDGSRERRLGMDLEEAFVNINTHRPFSSDAAVTTFSWKAPGGYTEKEFAVVQFGSVITILDSTTAPISGNVIGQYMIGTSDSSKMTFASVDGLMVIASGREEIYTFDYNGSSISYSADRLKIRDLFGVADSVSEADLLLGSGITVRTSELSYKHIYNLRNQTFAVPRKRQSGDPNSSADPITMFHDAYGTFPSNADNLVTFLYADANNEDDRNIRRFFYEDMFNNPLGTNRAPLGYFIIDALNRGASRLEQVQQLNARNLLLNWGVPALPTDRTPGGATVVCSYSGRVFYAGFSSQIIDGDSESPRMNSYVLFSRLVQGSSDIFKCYQDGDPTSSETPDLLDTDGGFIRLDGAYNIHYMVNVGDALMVVAENGVWKITGGSGYGFKATDYLTTKVTEHGSISPGSVVLVDNSFMYWADDGIYHVVKNQYGDWNATNLSTSTIQSFYDDISYKSKVGCQAIFDSYRRQVRWLYNNTLDSSVTASELILDINLGAFYPSEIKSIGAGIYPRPLGTVRVPPFETTTGLQSVISSSGDNIISLSSSNVVASSILVDSALSETLYVVATGEVNGEIYFSFGSYNNVGFKDWVKVDGNGIDAAAYMVTGWTGMGDFQRQKQVQYLTVYSIKTETGFNAEFTPANTSSIIVQSQWNWTNSAESGKWGPQFQAYRHKRLWMPPDINSGFDDGELVVTTKNKLRGRGKVLSLKFSTEPGKAFHLLGWSYLGGINGTV